jgi:hypothetical protein
MYQASLPVFVRMLNNLASVLEKGRVFAETKKIDPSVLINARLAPDMFALARQVQIATDGVKGFAARVAGIDIPSYADTEATFPELQERIAKTITFLKTFRADQIDGSEERTVTLKIAGKERSFAGQGYLLNFVLPNLYFHIAAAYAILRHNGVEIGKMDFLGKDD